MGINAINYNLMSCYLDQEKDFIFRTKMIIKQYDDYFEDKSGKEKYDVTLFLNALVGLLILPQQFWFDFLHDELVSKKDWGIDPSHIGFIKRNEKKSVKNVARHLRNSISHYRFKAFANSKKDIHQIDFEDEFRGKRTFQATIPIEFLRKFIDVFSARMLRIMRENK
jgi:hypothetical protein